MRRVTSLLSCNNDGSYHTFWSDSSEAKVSLLLAVLNIVSELFNRLKGRIKHLLCIQPQRSEWLGTPWHSSQMKFQYRLVHGQTVLAHLWQAHVEERSPKTSPLTLFHIIYVRRENPRSRFNIFGVQQVPVLTMTQIVQFKRHSYSQQKFFAIFRDPAHIPAD